MKIPQFRLIANILVGVTMMTFNAYSQNWTQIGTDIDGTGNDNWLSSMDLSADGSRLIVGENSFSSAAFTTSGRVRVFELVGGDWILMGTEMYAESIGNGFGMSVRITPDGNTIVCGESRSDVSGNQSGQVRVYFWDGNNWQPKGSWIQGATDAEFGSAVDINTDGTRISVGAPFPSNTNGVDEIGKIQIYEWNGTTWAQLGLDIVGDAAGDFFGANISMDMTGDVVAICGRANNSSTGQVKIYEWNGNSWIQRGIDLVGSGTGESYGTSVSLDADGNTLAIGAAFKSTNNGQVDVFNWDGTSWVLKGNSFVGSNGEWLGHSVDLSDDGNVLAYGAPFSDNGGLDAGYSKCYQWDGLTWGNVGNEIVGDAIHDYCGAFDISLNSAGDYVAAMAYGNDDGGSYAGQTRVFSSPFASVSENIALNQLSVFPNPTNDIIHVSSSDGSGNHRLEITNNLGQLLLISHFNGSINHEISVSGLPNGMYFISIIEENRNTHFSTFIKN